LDFLCDICAWMAFSWCCISSILSSPFFSNYKLSEEIENLISISDKLLKNGDDNIEEMQHQENAIHAQISQRKSKIMEVKI
jgi:hypothetical protein